MDGTETRGSVTVGLLAVDQSKHQKQQHAGHHACQLRTDLSVGHLG
jgi:hypothetical protein